MDKMGNISSRLYVSLWNHSNVVCGWKNSRMLILAFISTAAHQPKPQMHFTPVWNRSSSILQRNHHPCSNLPFYSYPIHTAADVHGWKQTERFKFIRNSIERGQDMAYGVSALIPVLLSLTSLDMALHACMTLWPSLLHSIRIDWNSDAKRKHLLLISFVQQIYFLFLYL